MPTPEPTIPPPAPTVPPAPTDTPNATATTAAKTAIAARKTAVVETATAARKTAVAKTATAARKTAVAKTATAAATQTAAAKTATRVAANKTATAIAGIPTATPTPTPTPTPQTTDPSAWIRAEPANLYVSQQTTVTAGSDRHGLTTRLVIANTAVLGRNAQCSTDGDEGDSGAIDYPTLPDPSPMTLWGCQRGVSEVQLWAGTTKLASVTVRVFSLSSVRFDERVGYRFFKIDWSSDPALVDFSVQWRNAGEQTWKPLSATALSGARAIIRSWLYEADIRGLPYDEDSNDNVLDIEIRVVGQTEEPGGFVGATPVLTVGRGEQPFAIGHLPDHTMRYSTSTLDRSTTEKSELAGWIEDVAQDSAEAWAGWASPVAELEVCNSACDENTDREILWVKNAGTCLYPRHYACVDGLANVEGSLTMNRNMLFEDEPETGSGANLVRYRWTNVRSLDQTAANGGAIYRWVHNVAVHEFGHAFGLADRYNRNNPDPGYVGIMKTIEKRSKTIKQDDIDSLRAIYKTHTRNHGW